jgi:hypothetical protein
VKQLHSEIEDMPRFIRSEGTASGERIVDGAHFAAMRAIEVARAARIASRLSVVEFRSASAVTLAPELATALLGLLEQHTRQTDVIGLTDADHVAVLCPDTNRGEAMTMLRRLARQAEATLRNIQLALPATHAPLSCSGRESVGMPEDSTREGTLVSTLHCGVLVTSARGRMH